MNTGNVRSGRPRSDESARRKARFLLLIADGSSARQAAKDAGLDPWRALEIVTESDYRAVVQAIRAGLAPDGIAVELVAPADAPLAA